MYDPVTETKRGVTLTFIFGLFCQGVGRPFFCLAKQTSNLHVAREGQTFLIIGRFFLQRDVENTIDFHRLHNLALGVAGVLSCRGLNFNASAIVST